MSDSVTVEGKKISRKWVKKARMWCKVIEEIGSKDTKGKPKIRITWHDDVPDLVDTGEANGTSPGSRLAKSGK